MHLASDEDTMDPCGIQAVAFPKLLPLGLFRSHTQPLTSLGLAEEGQVPTWGITVTWEPVTPPCLNPVLLWYLPPVFFSGPMGCVYTGSKGIASGPCTINHHTLYGTRSLWTLRVYTSGL